MARRVRQPYTGDVIRIDGVDHVVDSSERAYHPDHGSGWRVISREPHFAWFFVSRTGVVSVQECADRVVGRIAERTRR